MPLKMNQGSTIKSGESGNKDSHRASSLSGFPYSSKPLRGSLGLFNITNTCYMNSILIGLLYCKPISRSLLCDNV